MKSAVAVPWLLALFALGGCRDGEPAPAPKPSSPAPSTSAALAPSVHSASSSPHGSGAPTRPPTPAETLLSAWNAALDRRDAAALAPLYAPRVHFYGQWKTAEQVTSSKRAAFEKQPSFRQRIDDVHISKTDQGFVAIFQKHSGKDFAATVEGRLTMEPRAGKLAIAEESDSITDEKLKKPARSRCSETAWQIVGEQPVIVADIRRVASEMPEARPGGIAYEEAADHFSAAQGYFLPDHFDRRWAVEVEKGVLTLTDALTMEELPLTAEQRERVHRACD